jgi:hypothetical protein
MIGKGAMHVLRIARPLAEAGIEVGGELRRKGIGRLGVLAQMMSMFSS